MILNADDFGYSSDVDEGILALAATGRISSTSVMVKRVAPKNVQRLKRFEQSLDIGLHLQLTDDQPSSFVRLGLRAYMRRLSRAKILFEIQSQLALFHELFGREPDFLDGHQHVHQLPVVREAVVQAVTELKNLKYLRAPGLPKGWWRSHVSLHPRWVVANSLILIPGLAFRNLGGRRGLCHNRFLLGYYDYGKENFATIFERYLTLHPLARDVFFFHPALPLRADDTTDPIYPARLDAFAFLNSPRFDELQYKYGFVINRFPALGPEPPRPSTTADSMLI